MVLGVCRRVGLPSLSVRLVRQTARQGQAGRRSRGGWQAGFVRLAAGRQAALALAAGGEAEQEGKAGSLTHHMSSQRSRPGLIAGLRLARWQLARLSIVAQGQVFFRLHASCLPLLCCMHLLPRCLLHLHGACTHSTREVNDLAPWMHVSFRVEFCSKCRQLGCKACRMLRENAMLPVMRVLPSLLLAQIYRLSNCSMIYLRLPCNCLPM